MPVIATQTGRQAELKTPLGQDVLLITRLDAEESISTLFEFSITCIAKKETKVAFDKLMGQSVTAKLVYPGSSKSRFFNGICRTISQGESDIHWTHFQLGLVPTFWLLTRRTQSRIFQHLAVPDILKKVLTGLDVVYELKGKYEPRDYCVQYRESDYHFAARLMEEEGIYYYFKHADGSHKLVVADTPASHEDVPYEASILYKNVIQGPAHEEDLIYTLTKQQELASGKVTLWDHTFELPHKHVEAEQPIQESVAIGTATHKLKVANNDKLELYDYPGEYAQRFDGIDKGGGDRSADVQKIFSDNKRTVGIRMQAEAARSIGMNGASTCRQLTSGHKFSVKTLGDDPLAKPLESEGKYVLTSVSHHATIQDEYASGGSSDFSYRNTFNAIPLALAYRPQRTLEKPTVAGCQTAQVVGPNGEEIFTDKYGRVKVQFHWDREGKRDADSSCWIRVATPSAGRKWGIYSIPRIGQEVIVDFLEGDPDQPIIVGSVWNADQMPAYKLPDEKTKSWIKTNTCMGGKGHNEIRFEDKKAEEQIYIHAEKNQDIRVKNDCMEHIMHDRHMTVGLEKDGKKVGNLNEEVYVNKNQKVHKDQSEIIGGDSKLIVGGVDQGKGNQDIIIKGDKKELIEGSNEFHVGKGRSTQIDGQDFLLVKGDRYSELDKGDQRYVKQEDTLQVEGSQFVTIKKDRIEEIDGNIETVVGANYNFKNGADYNLKVGGKFEQKVGADIAIQSGGSISLKAGGSIAIEASAISLKVGSNFVSIGPDGVSVSGTMVKINSGGSASSAKDANPQEPQKLNAGTPAALGDLKEPGKADPTKPTQADNSTTGSKSCD